MRPHIEISGRTIALSVVLLTVLALLSCRALTAHLARKAAFAALTEQIRAEIDLFEGEAAVVVKDLDSNRALAFNETAPLPSASLAKLPVMASCFLAVSEGELDLSERIRLKNSHKVSGSGLLKSASAGSEFSVEELIRLMISKSDNTATNMLIRRLGFDYLNGVFGQLHLKDTNLDRMMMDFRERRKGVENYTSAGDIADLLDMIYRKDLVSERFSSMCLDYLKQQVSRDRIPAKLPADTVVAHKTGLEKGVCHDAGIVFTPGGDLLICVLTKHDNRTSARSKRFIARVARLAYDYRQKF
ncbi:serine hydrolase [Candidatus Omnitrophota bacterium]